MAAAVGITRTDHTAAGLRDLAVKSGDPAQSRRLLAIAMVLEGSSREDAARRTGMDRQTLRDWVHRYNEAGPGGLMSRTAPGAQPKLSEAQMAELRDLVDLVRAGKVTPLRVTCCALHDADKALNDLRAGRIVGRAVLAPECTPA